MVKFCIANKPIDNVQTRPEDEEIQTELKEKLGKFLELYMNVQCYTEHRRS